MTVRCRRLVLRCDAGRNVGGGHLMRCLSLAGEFRAAGGEATFISFTESELLRERVRERGFDLVSLPATYPDPQDGEQTEEWIRKHRPDWLILDGYHLEPAYQKRMQDLGVRVLVLDDIAHLPYYHADIIVNLNLGAEDRTYLCGEETRLLLGVRYALLREEFRRWRTWNREIPPAARRLLVTFGAVDPDNQTAKVLRAAARLAGNGLKDLEIVSVVGPANPHRDALNALNGELGLNVDFQHDPADLPELMAWADFAVSAGGSTCWELAFMGLPNLILVVADNQETGASNLDQSGVSQNLGGCMNVDSPELAGRMVQLMENADLRRSMSVKGRDLVDGEGAARICREMAVVTE